MNKNWWQVLLNPNLINAIVIGIQQIHGDAKSGADKKQLALESLGLAEGAAAVVVPAITSDPNNVALAQAAGDVAQAGIVEAGAIASKNPQQIASATIDQAVSAFKLAAAFGFKPSTPAPAATTAGS